MAAVFTVQLIILGFILVSYFEKDERLEQQKNKKKD